MEDHLLEIGKLGKPHGVKGKVRMVCYGDSPETLKSFTHVFVGTFATNRKLTIRAMSFHKKHCILEFESVDSIDKAKALTGAGVYIWKSSLPALAADEYYWIDLIGCLVVTEEGRALGSISEIIATGSNDVYVVTGEEGELLLPATTDVIKKVDIDGKTITVEMPQGMSG